MADERTHLGHESPAEIQRLLDEKRRGISQTLGEMKKSMNNEVENVKTKISSQMDVRTQMHRYPMAIAIGALALGFFAGRGIMAAKSHRDYELDYATEEDLHFDFEGETAGSGRRHRKPMISPQVRDRVSTRVEGALSEVADTFLSELVRVGRDVLVPRVMGALSGQIETKIHAHSPNDASRQSEHSYVGGNVGTSGRGPTF